MLTSLQHTLDIIKFNHKKKNPKRRILMEKTEIAEIVVES